MPRALLPDVRGSSEVYGETAPDLFEHPIPIGGIAGDQQAALVGQACFKPGMVKSTYGTGCFALLNTGETPVLSQNRLLTTPAYRIKGRTTYAMEGSIFAPPIDHGEIIAIAVMAADRAGIGLRIETEDVAPHAVTVWRRRLR